MTNKEIARRIRSVASEVSDVLDNLGFPPRYDPPDSHPQHAVKALYDLAEKVAKKSTKPKRKVKS